MSTSSILLLPFLNILEGHLVLFFCGAGVAVVVSTTLTRSRGFQAIAVASGSSLSSSYSVIGLDSVTTSFGTSL